VVDALADIKMLTCITTSQFTERLLYLMLVDGHYRKHLSRLRERLGEARISVVRAFERVGLEMFAEPTDGMFVWARLPNIADSFTLAESAHSEGILLAPGVVFRPHLERSPWMRFNVATCDDPRIMRWLERQLATARNRNTGCPSEGAFCP
jgi:DNA-binding transcriptional MocR family regulator